MVLEEALAAHDVKNDPTNFEAHYNLAAMLQGRGRLENAIKEYEAALRELVKAKVKRAPITREEPAPKPAKVINLMDALRKSVKGDAASVVEKKSRTKAAVGSKKGITLVKSSNMKTGRSRKTA